MNDQATPLLQPTPPAGDEQRVATVFAGEESHLGFVPDALKLYSISPDLLESFVGGVGYFIGQQRLSQELLAMIRYLTSERAGCRFCIDLNEGFLANLGVELDQARAAREDLEQAPLPARELPLLRLALKAVTRPEEVGPADLEAARNEGWSDRDIFDSVLAAASNRALNLVLKSFKVEQQGVFG